MPPTAHSTGLFRRALPLVAALLSGLATLPSRSDEPGSLWELACHRSGVLRVSTLFTAPDVRDRLASPEQVEQAIAWCKQTGITRIYLESFRGGYTADRDALDAASRKFREAGILVSGCITTTGLGKKAVRGWIFPCFTDTTTLERLEKEARYAAELFDEIMIDDFFATHCECDDCVSARGERSWSEFRCALLRDVSRRRLLEPAREVNPGVRVIIKYPQWYEDFRERGYDVDPESGQTAMFDEIWVGTETRDPDNARWGGKSQYEAYFILRWLGEIGGAKCGGGWFDPFGTSPDTYLEQARQTILAGAREMLLFCHGALQQETGPDNIEALRDELPNLFELAELVRQRAPRGLVAPRPIARDGTADRWVFDFVGLLGLPLVPATRLAADAPAVFVSDHVSDEPGLADRLKALARAGRPILATERLASALGWDESSPGGVEILEVPDDPWKLLDMPRARLQSLRKALLKPFGVELEAPTRVALYLFGDDVVVLENFADTDAKIELRVSTGTRVTQSLTLGAGTRAPETVDRGLLRTRLAARSLLALVLETTSDDSTVTPIDLRSSLDDARVETQDATASRAERDGRAVLRVETGTEHRWPGVTLLPADGAWDLSSHLWLTAEIRNVGSGRTRIHLRVDNPGADGKRHCLTESTTLSPGESGTVLVPLRPKVFDDGELELFGMRGLPPVVSELDPARITQLLFFVANPEDEHTFEVGPVRAEGVRPRADVPPAEAFFPMIDELGQYLHADWPGKSRSVEDLRTAATDEEKDLAAHREPAERSRWGGWSRGPRREASGFFRVERVAGAWWLIDPDGHLFWSHGIDCVRPNAPTPISDREHWFRNLPEFESAETCYGTGTWAPHGYYSDRTPYRTFDFFVANQIRKYGAEIWRGRFADLTHRRLRSWGLNTIANWSDRAIYDMRRTPYTATVSSGGKRLEGSKGYWGKFPDVFDPSFSKSLRARLAREEGHSAGDPWCIGYFVDNELAWGDAHSLAEAALSSPPEQAAKRAFLADLKAKYGTIKALNAAWGTAHETWNELLSQRRPPERERAGPDLLAFSRRTAETYFRKVRDALHEVAPDQLYLGCRFAWVNDLAARAATKYCDVVSYNRYTYSVADHRLPDGIDRPTIIGEFHFGSLDRGLFHTGLRKARSQAERADRYREYVLGALKNPQIVGTHWFQYKDQPVTGRGDGENYQIGFVDVCDRPYPEIVGACRDIGARLYGERYGAAVARGAPSE